MKGQRNWGIKNRKKSPWTLKEERELNEWSKVVYETVATPIGIR